MYGSAGDILLKHKDARYFAELGAILHQDRRLDTVQHVDSTSRRSSQSPIKAARATIAPAITAARSATSRRAASGIPVVTDRNVGARPIGSTTTKRVTAAEMRYSSGMAPPQRFRFVSDGVALRAIANLRGA